MRKYVAISLFSNHNIYTRPEVSMVGIQCVTSVALAIFRVNVQRFVGVFGKCPSTPGR